MAKGAPAKGQKTRKAANQRNLRSNRDEESSSLLHFEGGMMDDKKMMMEEEEEEETHCCCGQKKAIMIYAGFLWILGILVILNSCLIFGNMYFPVYYPLVSLIFALIYLLGLIFISMWMCSNTETNRKFLLTGAWLIFAAMVSLVIWNVFFILNFGNRKKKEGIKVGSGDDPEDYDEESRGGYILGYCIWGGVIIVIDIFLICVIYSYIKTYEEPEEQEKKEEMMMEEEKMMMMEEAEGGSIERRSNMSRASSSKRSQHSVQSQSRAQHQRRAPVATPQPPAAAPAPAPVQGPVSPQDQESKEEVVRNLHAAAIQEIDADDTPRNSLKEKFQYEDGANSTSVLFNEVSEEPQGLAPQPQSVQEPSKKQQSKKNKKNKKQKKQN